VPQLLLCHCSTSRSPLTKLSLGPLNILPLSCRCADAEYYWAEIIAYNKETGKHKVKYADRFTEDLHLPVEKLDWGPQVGADTQHAPVLSVISVDPAISRCRDVS